MNIYGSVDVEGCPNFVDLSAALLVRQLGSGESEELSEVDATGLVVIEFGRI